MNNESLKGKTPAKVAEVKYPYRNWQDVVAKRRIITPKAISSLSSATIPPIIELPTYRESNYKIVTRKRKQVSTKRGVTSGISKIRE